MHQHLFAGAFAAALAVGVGPASAVEQPHTQAALQYLESAKHEILIADQDHNHGGHAGEATRLIDEAIQEVRKAIVYRDEHPN